MKANLLMFGYRPRGDNHSLAETLGIKVKSVPAARRRLLAKLGDQDPIPAKEDQLPPHVIRELVALARKSA